MAFDHPTFSLQFDHDSLQEDQIAHKANSHETMSTKTAEHSGLNAGYNLKPNEISLNSDGCSKYSSSSSSIINNVAPDSNSDSNQICSVDEVMNNESDIQDSEITKYANYSEMLRDLGQESKMVVLQYLEVFGDSEVYEQQASQAITDLTAHAHMILQNLHDQKKALCSRINSISEILKHEC